MNQVTALIADDEPLLRQRLRAHLAQLWPALQVVAEARNGLEAVELYDAHQPQVVFMDIHMPGQDGIDTARALGRKAHLVFVTAFDRYAVQAFDQGAIDYIVKPIDPARLADTVQRLQARLAQAPGPEGGLDAVLDHLRSRLDQPRQEKTWLRWIKASVGASVRLIPVDQVIYLRADEKYTAVAWTGGEALIRKGIKELAEELDPASFVQVHRSVIVNLHYVTEIVRGVNETADLHVQGRPEVLPVSRSYLHHFRQM